MRGAAVGSFRAGPAANGNATAQSCGTSTSGQPLSSNFGIAASADCAGLGKGALVAAEAEILLDVGGMAEMKAPALQPLAPAALR